MNPITALRRSTHVALLGALLFAASGCAMLTPKTPEQQVSTRAADYWKSRQAGDFTKSYGYATPAYRSVKNVAAYQSQFGSGVAVKDSQVNKVVCAPQRCNVQMKLSVVPSLVGIKIGPIDMYVDEVWLLEDGQWWLFQEL